MAEHDDVEPTDVEPTDDGSLDVDDADRADRPARRAVLDGRTLAICALVALIAAIATYVGISSLTGEDEDDDAQRADLTLAEEVPDLALPALDGSGDTSLTDYAGTPLVVNFWGSWCTPCVEEMPDLQAVYDSLDGKVAFVGVNVNDSVEAATSMAERTGVTYDLIRDIEGRLIQDLEVTTFPTTLLVDAEGTIVDTVRRQISAERLCEKINQSLLNQSLEQCG